METRCPHCDTRYQIDRETLTAANGLVRCSRCRNVFNAQNQISAVPNDTEPLPETEQAQGPTEVKADLPAMAAETLAGETVQAEAKSKDDTQTLAAPLPTPDVDLLGLDETNPNRSSSRLNTMLISLLALILAATLLGQLAWFERDRLMSQPKSRKVLEQTCDLLGCTLPVWRDPSLYQILHRKLAPATGNEQALTLEGQFINRAQVPQPLPLLQITFLDSNEMLLARRRLTPEEYLSSPTLGGQYAAPEEVFTIDIQLEDPGPQATGFELSFY